MGIRTENHGSDRWRTTEKSAKNKNLGGRIEIRGRNVVERTRRTFEAEERPHLSWFDCTHTTGKPSSHRRLDKAWGASFGIARLRTERRNDANHISQTCLNPNLVV
jgi:hypothetical protein